MRVNSNYIRKQIIGLCKTSAKYSSDDKALIAAIWQREGWDNNLSLYQNLCKVSSPETIRRTRQKLQEEGLIKKREATNEARYHNYEQAKLSLGYY